MNHEGHLELAPNESRGRHQTRSKDQIGSIISVERVSMNTASASGSSSHGQNMPTPNLVASGAFFVL
jgi:hypothetical protein